MRECRPVASYLFFSSQSYLQVIELLESKSNSADSARRRADALKERANKLAAETYAKLELLRGELGPALATVLFYVGAFTKWCELFQ